MHLTKKRLRLIRRQLLDARISSRRSALSTITTAIQTMMQKAVTMHKPDSSLHLMREGPIMQMPWISAKDLMTYRSRTTRFPHTVRNRTCLQFQQCPSCKQLQISTCKICRPWKANDKVQFLTPSSWTKEAKAAVIRGSAQRLKRPT